MLGDSIKARLKQKDLDPGMLKLQEEFRKLPKRSRGGISKSYTKWDRNIAVYRGNRLRDEKDLQAVLFSATSPYGYTYFFAEIWQKFHIDELCQMIKSKTLSYD